MKLPESARLRMLAKLPVVLAVEALTLPVFLPAALFTSRLLPLQNRLRQRALGWLFPEVKVRRD